MSRKAILVCAAAAAALLAVVAVAVAVLYSGTGSGEETLDDSRYELLAAVPTDAVAVMRFESVGDMISLLADNSSVLNQFTGSYGQSSFVNTTAKDWSSSIICLISSKVSGRICPGTR